MQAKYRKHSTILVVLTVLIAFVLTACAGNSSQPLPSSTPQPSVAKAGTPVPAPEATLPPPTIQAVTPAPSPEASLSAELFAPEAYPRVDGSTATIPLSEALFARLTGSTIEEAQSRIKHNKTHEAYVNLIEKKADIILVTSPSEEELKLAKEAGVELQVIPVVKDAFVLLVNEVNPVQSLTIAQLQDIYQGKITNWKEVGGDDHEIMAFQRPINSGSQTLMLSLLMQGKKPMEAPTEKRPQGMDDLIDVVANFDNSEKALGYSVFYYANDMYIKDTVRLLGVEGVVPDQETIRSGKYPLISYYYAVLRGDEPADSPASQLLNYLLSDDGQAVAESSGYVPLH